MANGFVQQFIEWVIHHGGLYLLLLIVFAETGLFLGFFLPGDSLLFAAGIYINDLAANFFNVHYSIIVFMVTIASFTGSIAGHWFGYKTGRRMYVWKDGLLFKKKYLIKAKDFYQQYGGSTIFLSKFFPIIRTFAPIISGIVKMPKKKFLLYNITGSVCWVTSMMLGGYFFQSLIQKKFGLSLKDHIESITIVIVLITTVPILYKLIIARKEIVNRKKSF